MKSLLVILFCLSLIGCSGNQIVKTEYIRPDIPDIPEEPVYYSVRWHKVEYYYCVDGESAKNLIKNIELMRGYQQELRLILEEIRWKGNGTEKEPR